MSGFTGIFGRKTPKDWLDKLRADYQRLCHEPADRNAAIDLFMTSELIVDWLHPNDKRAREKLRKSDVRLQIASHLANQTKHYEAKAKHHTSVSAAEFEEPAFDRNAFDSDTFQVGGLTVRLSGKAEEQLGPSIEAVELARRLLELWESKLK